ncbi:MAG: hypothetical protein ABIH22_04460 [Candidatus Margulisiibacteriota bacterium]
MAKGWGTTFPTGIRLSKRAFRYMDNRNLLPMFSAEEGAQFLDQQMGFPSLLIRPFVAAQNDIQRIYILQEEFEEVRAHFDLPAEILKETFFIRAGRAGRATSNIVPRWSELLDPEWRKDFLCWIAGKGGLPSSSELPWETQKYGLMTMPAYFSTLGLDVGKGKKPLSGKLVLSESPSHRLATFHYKLRGKMRSALYSLEPDKFERIQGALKPEETFTRADFLELFGPRPQRGTYTCSRKAGKNEVSFGNVQGLPFRIKHGTSVPIIKGNLYYFDFIITEDGNTLEIKCYTNPEKKSLHGWFNIELNIGYPRSNRIVLLSPSEKP